MVSPTIFQKLKANWGNGVWLLFCIGLFIASINGLFNNLRELNFGIASCALILYAVYAIAEIFTYWQKFNHIEAKQEHISEYSLFSQQWFSKDFPVLVAIFVINIPIIVIFAIAIFSGDAWEPVAIPPEHQKQADLAGLLFAVSLLSSKIKESDGVKQNKAIEGLLSLIEIVGMAAVLILVVFLPAYT